MLYFCEKSVVFSNTCVNPSPRIKILFVLLLACALELISAQKMTTFTPVPPLGCEKVSFESNPIPYSAYPYFSMSLFLVSLIAPNKQFCKIRSKLLRLDFRSYTMYMFTVFP